MPYCSWILQLQNRKGLSVLRLYRSQFRALGHWYTSANNVINFLKMSSLEIIFFIKLHIFSLLSGTSSVSQGHCFRMRYFCHLVELWLSKMKRRGWDRRVGQENKKKKNKEQKLMFMIFALILCYLISSEWKPWKRDSSPDLSDAVPVPHQLSYLANWELGPVSRKFRDFFGPEKPVVKLHSSCFEKPIF